VVEHATNNDEHAFSDHQTKDSVSPINQAYLGFKTAADVDAKVHTHKPRAYLPPHVTDES
jgi:hypothetical protein